MSMGVLLPDPNSEDTASSEPQSTCVPSTNVCSTSERGEGARNLNRESTRDTLLDELRMWVSGLETIGDAEHVVALLVKNEVSLANLELFTVDELASTGVGEAAACELLRHVNLKGVVGTC